MKHSYTSDEITTNGTIETLLNTKGGGGNGFTKLTLQVMDGATIPAAGLIAVNAKVDAEHPNAKFQKIGEFDMTAKVPLFIQGSYEVLEFVGSTMTASSSAFIAITASN